MENEAVLMLQRIELGDAQGRYNAPAYRDYFFQELTTGELVEARVYSVGVVIPRWQVSVLRYNFTYDDWRYMVAGALYTSNVNRSLVVGTNGTPVSMETGVTQIVEAFISQEYAMGVY